MELLVAILIAILFATGTYMVLCRRFLRVIFGTGLLTHGTLLFLMTSGKLERGAAPILIDGVETYTDPIPQALILTAIVINFAVTAFALVLAYRLYQDTGADDLLDLTGLEENLDD